MARILIFIIGLFASSMFAQEIGVNRTKSNSYVLNENSIIFDKETESKINFNDLDQLLNKYPNASVEPKEEDVLGQPISFYFIKDFKSNSTDTNYVQINRNDILGSKFDLETVNSKYTLIILQLDLEFPMINVESIKEAEEAAIKRGYVSVILTSSKIYQAKNFSIEQGLRSIVIPEANNLMHKFNSNRFPLFVILDSNKSILHALKNSYEVEDEFLVLD